MDVVCVGGGNMNRQISRAKGGKSKRRGRRLGKSSWRLSKSTECHAIALQGGLEGAEFVCCRGVTKAQWRGTLMRRRRNLSVFSAVIKACHSTRREGPRRQKRAGVVGLNWLANSGLPSETEGTKAERSLANGRLTAYRGASQGPSQP